VAPPYGWIATQKVAALKTPKGNAKPLVLSFDYENHRAISRKELMCSNSDLIATDGIDELSGMPDLNSIQARTKPT